MYVLTCKPLQCIPEPVDEDLRLCSFKFTELGEIPQAQKEQVETQVRNGVASFLTKLTL